MAQIPRAARKVRPLRSIMACAFALVVLALAGGLGQRIETAQAGSGLYLGVWQPNPTQGLTTLRQYETDAGKHAAIVSLWRDWAADAGTLDTTWLSAIAAHGSLPFVTWDPTNWSGGDQSAYSPAAISAGGQDGYISGWARQLAAYGKPVLLRTMEEMNGTWNGWSGNPTSFVAAWRHIHDLFAQAGAGNVLWVWSPNIWYQTSVATDARAYYPGDGYVDWIALDGMNNTAQGWETFTQLFQYAYNALSGSYPAKPLAVSDVSSGEATSAQAAQGLSKAKWITSALAIEIPRSFPRLKALLWFNEDTIATQGQPCCDWRIESSSAAQSAYRKAVAGSYYIGSAPVLTASPASSPSPSPTGTATPSATVSPTPSPTASPSPTPGPSPSPTPSPTPAPQQGTYLGVWQPDPTTGSLTTVQQFETDAGKHMAIVMFWMDWAADHGTLNPSWLSMIDQHGSLPMITWSPSDWSGGSQTNYTTQAIASGVDDGYIKSFATTLKSYGKPVLLRTMHEMNGTWYANWSGNPSSYVAAWRHIHDLFVQVGASNVQFVWCPSYWVTAWGDSSPLAYYPGDAYVDWVAVDGYNSASPNWVTFSQLFDEDYNTLTSTYPTRPLMIAEFGSTEPTSSQAAAGASKAQWFTQAFADVQARYPKIRALVYFNEDKTQAESCNCDWPIESDAAAQQAYQQAVAPAVFLNRYP